MPAQKPPTADERIETFHLWTATEQRHAVSRGLRRLAFAAAFGSALAIALAVAMSGYL